jgi:hypothetical protein
MELKVFSILLITCSFPVAVLEELTSLCPAPACIRSDNGPEFNCFAEALWLRSGPAGLVRGRRSRASRQQRLQSSRDPGKAPTRPYGEDVVYARKRRHGGKVEIHSQLAMGRDAQGASQKR